MKLALFLLLPIAAFAQNPSPCLNIVNTAGAGQVLSAVNGGSTTPPCKWIANGGGGGSGTVTHINTTLPIQGGPITTTGTISCRAATGSVSGCLSAADWATFNSKAGIVAAFSQALATAPIASGAKATLISVSTPGVLSTDVPVCSFNGDFTGVTGYIPSTNGMLAIGIWPSADHVNIQVVNNTAAPITPGAITLNCTVPR